MKTGVTLSGCDLGGISAYHVLALLEQQGQRIDMISASGIPALGVLCYGAGLSEDEYNRMATDFLVVAARDIDSAVGDFAEKLNLTRRECRLPVAIATVNLSDGKAVAFTNAFSLKGENLATFPLSDSYDVLSAAVSLCGGLATYPYKGYKLCDYATWYGAPYAPLTIAGMKRVMSISFCPAAPSSPYDAMITRMIGKSTTSADFHLDIEFPAGISKLCDYYTIAIKSAANCMKSNLSIDSIF